MADFSKCLNSLLPVTCVLSCPSPRNKFNIRNQRPKANGDFQTANAVKVVEGPGPVDNVYIQRYIYIILCIYIHKSILYIHSKLPAWQVPPCKQTCYILLLVPFWFSQRYLSVCPDVIVFQPVLPPSQKNNIYIYERERSAQNLNWKVRFFFVKVIVFGSSLSGLSFYSISWLHHPHPLANCMRKAVLHLHFSVCSIFDCPALSFAALQLYGTVWYLPMQPQITVAPSFLKLRNKLWIQFVGRSPGELSQRHAPCLSFTRQRLRSKPSTWSNAFALAIFI